MKKFFYSMMACALAFANVACSDDEVSEAANGGNGESGPVAVIYSFSQKAYLLGQSTELTVELLDKNAKAIVADEDITVTLLVDEATTAIEGVNFEVESKTATVAKGSNKCTFVLRSIASDEVATIAEETEGEEDETKPEPGKTIVLGLQIEDSKLYEFKGGSFPKATVNVVGSMVSNLYGTWVMNEVLTTKEFMEDMWGDMVSGYEYLPVVEVSDKFIFEDGKLKTELTSTLKNYFRPESEFVFGPERPADKNTGVRPVDSMDPIALQMIELQNVNRYFSATEMSADKVALVGLRNIMTDDGEILLDVYVLDHESRSFMPEMAEFGMYGDEKPTAWLTGTYINFTLKRAE